MNFRYINGHPVPIKTAAERDVHMINKHHEQIAQQQVSKQKVLNQVPKPQSKE
jgi:hypothetical protein